MSSPLAKGLFQRMIGESDSAYWGPAIPGTNLGRPLRRVASQEAAGVKFMAALKATSLADLRKKTSAEILNTPSDPSSSVRPLIDGYVLPERPAVVFDSHQQNDVPLLAGSNADEGSVVSFIRTRRIPGVCWQEHGAFPEDFLKVCPASSDVEACRASEKMFRETIFAWQNLQYVETQARTGKSKVFYYHFTHTPPARPNECFAENLGKDLGLSRRRTRVCLPEFRAAGIRLHIHR
jgi:para-nitrobenzyl esterase